MYCKENGIKLIGNGAEEMSFFAFAVTLVVLSAWLNYLFSLQTNHFVIWAGLANE